MEDIIDIIVTETTNLIEITSQPTDEVIDVNIIDNREDITLNVTPSVVEININQLTGNFGILWGEIEGTLSNQTDLQNALNLKADLVDGKVPSSQLPSYVDDIVEVATYSALPAIGETGKIYVVLDTNLIYRWSGSAYIEIKDSSAVWGAITGTLSNQTDLQTALNAKANDSEVVKLAGVQTITGIKVYNAIQRFNFGISVESVGGANQGIFGNDNGFNLGVNAYTHSLLFPNSGGYNFTFPATSGTIALTSDLHNAVTLGTANGLSLSTQILSLGLASSSANGALSSTDWTTFNNKQNALTNPVTGTGTTNYVPKFTATSVLSDSNIQDSGSLITLNSNSFINGNLALGSTTAIANRNISNRLLMTGGSLAIGYELETTIMSDVTSDARGFSTFLSTTASSFTLANLYHYRASQSTIGAGSSITTQTGFEVAATLIGATTNYGFRGLIAAGTNRWNLYMDGTANNYFGGGLGIGSTSLTGVGFRQSRNITGAINSNGIISDGQIQSDANNNHVSVNSILNTQATTFTLASYTSFNATLGTLGSGTTITNLYGYRVNSALNSGTNNYGFYGDLAAATGRWNLYMNGTANNYMAGSLGIGGTSLTGFNLLIQKDITGATSSFGIHQTCVVRSTVTSAAYVNSTNIQVENVAFTLPILVHYRAAQNTFGASATVTNQYGFSAESTLTGATNNYGFYGGIAAGTNRWNIYMAGTADNYLNGALGIGTTSLTAYNLKVSKTLTGGVTAYGITVDGQIQSDVTTQAWVFQSNVSTAAATFNVAGGVRHFFARNITLGSGSTIGNQWGFYVEGLTSGSSNFGFYGDVASGSNRWNLYMNGTANNYLAGNLLIGSTADNGSKLQVTGSSTYSSTITMNGGGVGDNPIQLIFNTAVNRLLTPVLRLYGATNIASNYVELLGTNATANRIISFPDASGTVVLTSDLTSYLLKSGGTLTGKVNVSVNIADYAFTITNTNTSGYGMYIQAGGTNNLIDGYNSTGVTNTFRVSGTGVIFSNTLGTGLVYSNAGSLTSTNPSDSRLKSDIKRITYGLKDILKLRPVSYNWKDDKVNQGIQFGFIAQEVQEVIPEAIKEFGDETKFLGLEKDAIYATLVNAIQELKAELDTLKNK